jgi:hypothetical protein
MVVILGGTLFAILSVASVIHSNAPEDRANPANQEHKEAPQVSQRVKTQKSEATSLDQGVNWSNYGCKHYQLVAGR